MTGAAAIQVALDLLDRQPQARRTAIDDDAYRAAVRFAEGGDAEHVAKGRCHRGKCTQASGYPKKALTGWWVRAAGFEPASFG